MPFPSARRLKLALVLSFPLLAWTRLSGAFALWGTPSRDDGVFVSRELTGFDGDAQFLAPGFNGDDFHVQVPRGGSVQRLVLDGRKLVEERIALGGFQVVSNYDCAPLGGRALVFQLGGLDLIDLRARRSVRDRELWQDHLCFANGGFVFPDPANGCVFAQMDFIPDGPPTEANRPTTQLHRFGEDLKSEVLLELPARAEVIPLADGFVVCPTSGPLGSDRAPYRSYRFDGQPRPSALERTLNTFHPAGGETLTAPAILRGSFGLGLLYATHLERPWALVSLKATDTRGEETVRPAILTVGAAEPHLADITFPAADLRGNEEPQSAAVSPTHDLFLASSGGRDEAKTLWLGVVTRDGQRHHVRCFRLRTFEVINDLTLSRDGSTVIFADWHKGRSVVVMARVADLVAEANRRHPEAKLDFGALRYPGAP